MRSLLLSRRDLDFLLYEWLHAEELVSSARFAEHSRETFDGYLDLCADLATRYFAPHNKLADANEPTFDGTRVTMIPEVKRAVQAFGQADLVGAAMDAAVGGMQADVDGRRTRRGHGGLARRDVDVDLGVSGAVDGADAALADEPHPAREDAEDRRLGLRGHHPRVAVDAHEDRGRRCLLHASCLSAGSPGVQRGQRRGCSSGDAQLVR